MKIIFDDGSYLEIVTSGDKTRITMCGIKTNRELTMSMSELDKEQVKQVIGFLTTINL